MYIQDRLKELQQWARTGVSLTKLPSVENYDSEESKLALLQYCYYKIIDHVAGNIIENPNYDVHEVVEVLLSSPFSNCVSKEIVVSFCELLMTSDLRPYCTGTLFAPYWSAGDVAGTIHSLQGGSEDLLKAAIDDAVNKLNHNAMTQRKIIYVFGPNRLHEKYMKGEVLDFIKDFGYLKIGETTSSDPNEDKWDVAFNRVKGEAKTGIPETCRIYDVFEYPLLNGITSGKMDDRIRRILTKDMYSLDNSKDNNNHTQKAEYEINAGMEFVYGANRKQILNAIAKFERDLIIEIGCNQEQDKLKILLGMIQKNIEDTQDEDTDNDTEKEQKISHTSALGDHFWQLVDKKLQDIGGNIICTVSTYTGRPYISINKKTDWQFSASYSVRHSQATVSLEVYRGEDMCTTVENFIGAHSEEMSETIPELSSATQGVKDKNKWYWKIVGPYDIPQEKLVEWFAENILKMVSAFSTLTFDKM